MLEQYKGAYQSIGKNTYLTLEFGEECPVIESMIGTITANSLSHFLETFRLMVNGDTVIRYNVSSRQSLNTLAGNRKIKKREAIALLEGAIKAIKETVEYRLPEFGLVMDPEYIFIDPNTFEPGFVYLPVKRQNEKGLKELIIDLIMQGRIEVSNDNFIQLLLETVNSELFSVSQLEKCISPFKEVQAETMQKQKGISNPPTQKPFSIPQPVPIPQPASIPKAEIPPVPRQQGFPQRQKERPEKANEIPAKQAKKASLKEDSGFDAEAAKIKFMLPQAVIMVAIAACVSFGVFLDETGALALNNLLAAVILVVLIEVILYREVYVNSKKPKKKGKGKPQKKEENRSMPKPPAPVFNSVPAPVPQSTQAPGAGILPQTNNTPKMPEFIQPVPAPVPYFDSMNNDEATELDEGAPYLEYYENGQLLSYTLREASTLVGHLSGQVNLVIHNPKVGRVHAEFVIQNGKVYVRDLNSLNGTYINGSGQRLNSNVLYPLNDNDKIRLANCELTFHYLAG